MLRLLLVAIALLFLLPAAAAQAATCAVGIADIAFGDVDSIGTTATASTTEIDIQCDGVTPGTERISLCAHIGAGDGGSSGAYRLLRTAGGELAFGLYATGGAVPWGSAATPALGQPYRFQLPVTGDSASGSVTLHAMIPTGQSTAPVGSYHAGFSEAEIAFAYAEGDLDCNGLSGSPEARSSFAIDAGIVANCRLETSDLNFGTTGRIGENIDAEAGLDLLCTAGTGYGIAIDGGGAGDATARRLTSGDNAIRYDLYSDAEHSSPWGMATGSMVMGDGDGIEQHYRVYGRIPPQPAASGAYADTVVVTIVYD